MSYVQIYTGNGKGKTTAALGLLLRASGAGLRARVFQFLKRGDYSEIEALRARFPDVEVTQFGSGRFVNPKCIPEEELRRASDGLSTADEASSSGDYDLVILDEALGAVSLGLLPAADVLRLMRRRHTRTELVLTGRDAPPEIVEAADLCTEMRCVKHYYESGVPARKGIEF